MLKQDIFLGELLKLRPSSVGDYCETILDAERLRDELLGDGPFTRKSICDFLDIQESTLTRWFQTGRIPRAAVAAYVLFLALQGMQDEVRRRKEEAEDVKVVETNGKYAVCKFRQEEDGEVLGQVIAENIADLGTARALAVGVSPRSAKFLEQCERVIEERLEGIFDSEGYEIPDHPYRQISSEASDRRLLLTDYEAWKKKRRPVIPATLEEL